MLVVGLSTLMPGALEGIEGRDVGALVRGICASDFAKSLFWLAFLAIVMSTADSILNALATMWAHDLIEPLWQKGSGNDKGELWSVPLVTVFFGLFSIVFALFVPLKSIDFQEYAYIVFSLLAIPFVLGVLGLKGDDKGFRTGVGTFLVVFLTIRFMGHSRMIDSLLHSFNPGWEARESYFDNPITNLLGWGIALPISLFSFLTHHYMANDGHFVFILREEGTWKVSDRYKLNFNLRFLKEPVAWANEKVASNGLYISMLFIINFVLGTFPLVAGSTVITQTTMHILFTLFGIGMTLVCFLAADHLWYPSAKRYYNLAYLFCLWHVLCFNSNLALLQVADNGLYMVIHMIVALGLLAFLVDWQRFLLFQSSGMVTAVLFSWFLQGSWPLTAPFVVCYVVIGFICLLLAHQKYHLRGDVKQRLAINAEETWRASSMYEATREQLRAAMHDDGFIIKEINASLAEIKKGKDVGKSVDRLEEAIANLKERTAIVTDHMPLNVKKVAISSLLDNVLNYLGMEGIETADLVVLNNNATISHIYCDEYLIVKAIASAITTMLGKEGDKHFVFDIEERRLVYKLPGKTRKIPALCFVFSYPDEGTATANNEPHPADMDHWAFLSEDTPTPKELQQSKRIIQAHYGSFRNHPEELCYVIPQNVNQVRPNIDTVVDEDLLGETDLSADEDKAFLAAVKAHHPTFNMESIEGALGRCKHYHRKQKRKTGEPYYHHPVAVATMLLPCTKDEDVIIAALLHDLVEDTAFSPYQMELLFGRRVANIVEEVTHLHDRFGRKVKLSKSKTLKDLLEKGSKESLLVKVADRLHNMRTIEGHPPAKQKEIAQETLDFFVPTAKELNQPALATALEELANKVLKEE